MTHGQSIQEQNWVEMSILCNMMVSPEISEIALGQLHEEYFRDQRNRSLFRAIQSVGSTTVGRFDAVNKFLEQTNTLDAAGGKAYVTCVYLYVPVGDIDSFINLLIPKAA